MFLTEEFISIDAPVKSLLKRKPLNLRVIPLKSSLGKNRKP